jgi:feruloyl esterase
MSTALVAPTAFLPTLVQAAPTATCAALATNSTFGLAGGNPNIIAGTLTTQIVAAAPASSVTSNSTPDPTPATPAYCQVNFTYTTGQSGPADGYDVGQIPQIKIQVTLPLNSLDGGSGGVQGNWVGKIMVSGSAGSSTTLNPTTYDEGRNFSQVGYPIRLGYVGAISDNGNISRTTVPLITSGPQAGQLATGPINDWTHLGTHYAKQWAVSLANTYYASAPTRVYYNGCSGGGNMGMGQLMNYGNEYDGFVIGAPAYYWQQFRLAEGWGPVVFKKLVQQGGTLPTSAQFTAVNNAATAACDVMGLDTVADGIVADPRACTFSAKASICGASTAPAAPTCLTPAQAAAIDRVWDGPRNRFGKRIYYPYDRGIALTPSATVASNTTQVVQYDHRSASYTGNEVYADVQSLALAGNPTNGIAFDSEAELGSTTTDDFTDNQTVALTVAKAHGVKVIQLHGMQDANITFQQDPAFYRRVAVWNSGNGTADYNALQSWYRLFPMPGVAHCTGALGGGPGPSATDVFTALTNWVENGVAPATITARGGAGAPATRTRPLCPWPQTAIYNGTGSTDDASNFRCGGNLDANANVNGTVITPVIVNPIALCSSARVRYKHEAEPTTDIANTNLDVCKGAFPTYTHDFAGNVSTANGQVTSDVLWRNTSGNVGMWLMNGSTTSSTGVLGSVPMAWAVVGQRDFNAIGESSVLWRDDTGNVGVWQLNGTQVTSTSVIGNVPTTWSVVATGDFNADGNGDILWRDNSGNLGIWFMNGSTIASTAMLGNVPLTWSVVGADMKGDIFWRNTMTGEVGMWVMIDTQVAQTVNFGVVPLNWTIAGIGDFDGNGSADLLWRDTSGNVGIWLMNGTQILSTSVLGNVPTNWNVAQTGDYNGDGKSDILWIDNSGNVGAWFMNGGTMSSTASYGNVGTTWMAQSLNAD